MGLKLAHARLAHAQEEMVIKRYTIPFPSSVILGGSESSKTREVKLNVKWDPKKTTINQALFTAILHGRNDGWPLWPRSFEARFYVNDYLVAARGWGAVSACENRTIETNIGAHLINGENRFKLEVVGSFGPAAVGPDAITTALEVWFTGKEPGVKPPPPEWWLYAKWAMVGIGAVAVVGFVLPKAIETLKRR